MKSFFLLQIHFYQQNDVLELLEYELLKLYRLDTAINTYEKDPRQYKHHFPLQENQIPKKRNMFRNHDS